MELDINVIIENLSREIGRLNVELAVAKAEIEKLKHVEKEVEDVAHHAK